jgi:hypothetical protein
LKTVVAATGVSTDELALAGAALGAVALVMTYAIFRMRRRRKQLVAELSDSPEVKEDRAHNQIRLASAEADILERAGVDVARPRDLLAQAQARLERRAVDEAISLARSAHEALVVLKRGEPSTPLASEGRESFGHRFSPVAAGVPSSSSAVAPLAGLGERRSEQPSHSETMAEAPPPISGSRLPKNRVESHFQLRLLSEELDQPTPGGSPAPTHVEAEKLRDDAQRAYDSGDFTEALRLALKGRRRLGARIEALPPSPGSRPATDAPSGPEAAPSGEAAATESCPRCGRANRPSDRFCRACGAPRQLSKCPRCGTPAAPADQFCGGCGSPLA